MATLFCPEAPLMLPYSTAWMDMISLEATTHIAQLTMHGSQHHHLHVKVVFIYMLGQARDTSAIVMRISEHKIVPLYVKNPKNENISLENTFCERLQF